MKESNRLAITTFGFDPNLGQLYIIFSLKIIDLKYGFKWITIKIIINNQKILLKHGIKYVTNRKGQLVGFIGWRLQNQLLNDINKNK